jgi:hypothetical protein
MLTTKSESDSMVKNSGKAWLKLCETFYLTAVWVHVYEEKGVRTMDTICFYNQI